MASRTLLALTLSLCGAVSVLCTSAIAQTPLSQATVQKTRNEVKLLKQQQQRPAKIADILTPGDALRTYRRAMAELRFNDNSLARVGEQALFQFEPNTRNFNLKSGTVLLLIPPGQGRTTVRTPSATAGIRGSALFVRYIDDSGVTMVGALTNSDIEISSLDGTKVVLKAGQLGYVYKDRIGVYNFDQRRFQETSPFFKDLDWNTAPTEVKAEIEAALAAQQPFAGKVESTPTWTMLPDNRATVNAGVVSNTNSIGLTAIESTLKRQDGRQILEAIKPPENTGAAGGIASGTVTVPTTPGVIVAPPPLQPGTRPEPVTISEPTTQTPATPNQVPSAAVPPTRPTPAPTPPVVAAPATPAASTPPLPATVVPASPAVNNAPAAVSPPPAVPTLPTVTVPAVSATVNVPTPIATPAATVTTPAVQVPAAATPTIDRSPVQPAATVPATVTTPVTTPATGAGVTVQTGTTTRPLPIVP